MFLKLKFEQVFQCTELRDAHYSMSQFSIFIMKMLFIKHFYYERCSFTLSLFCSFSYYESRLKLIFKICKYKHSQVYHGSVLQHQVKF